MRQYKKILIFRKSSLGDIILTLPIVQILVQEFPDAQLDFITKTQYAPIVNNHPSIDNVITFENSGQLKQVITDLRKKEYDLLIDLQANFQSFLLGIALNKAKRSKYPKRRLARELVVRRPQLKLKVDHTISAYAIALKRLGINTQPSFPILPVPAEAREFASKFIAEKFSSAEGKLIALCPGARHFEKRWPRFRELAEELLKDQQNRLLVFTSAEDNVASGLGISNPRLAAIVDLDILKAAALLSECASAVSNDSGLMHLACAVQTPVVAIFGPTNPRLGFAPTYPGSRVICDDVFCSPCSVHGQKKCSQQTKYCFDQITPQRIMEALRNLQ